MFWSIILAAGGIFGIYLAGKKNNLGWLLGLMMQLLWIVYALVTKQYGFILSAIAYSLIYGKNFLSWKKEEKEIHNSKKLGE